MLSYQDFKKGYLTEWVDRSQAARKAAEELANKEVGPSLRDRYKRDGIVFFLNGHNVEFKSENERRKDGTCFFTWNEAMKRFGEPDADGWRLPTMEELDELCEIPYDFDIQKGLGVFDKSLSLPAMGYLNEYNAILQIGTHGRYWTSTSELRYAITFEFSKDCCLTCGVTKKNRETVRLVRDVK